MKKIGVDIGGTQLRVAVFDELDQMLDCQKFGHDLSKQPQEALAETVAWINENRDYYQFNSIGIGCPGPLNLRLGRVLNPPNLPNWHGFEIVRFFEDATGIKTLLNNDANVAGLAEAVDGSGRGYQSVYFIGMSTGIGGAYVVDEKIVDGANSCAAEIWNMIVCEDEYQRDGVNAGAMNEVCSGSAIARRGSEVAGKPMSTKEVLAAAQAGDPGMVAIVDSVVTYMARGISMISCVCDPEVFVIGGSVALHNPWLVDRIREEALRLVLNPQFLRLRVARFGDDAGLLGAALLV